MLAAFPAAHGAFRQYNGSLHLDLYAIARQALEIAADICIYTNANLTVETLEVDA